MSLICSLSSVEVLDILAKVNELELQPNIEIGLTLLEPIVSDFFALELRHKFPKPLEAEIYLRVGSLLRYYGSFSQKKDYQELSKNYATRAIELFAELGNISKLAESERSLGVCYWRLGEMENAEVLLSSAISRIEDRFDPIRIQAQTDLLMTYTTISSVGRAMSLIAECLPICKIFDDNKIKTAFYMQVGFVYSELAPRYDLSVFYYNEAIKCAFHSNNIRYLALAYNNIATIYGKLGRLDEAEDAVRRAIDANKNYNNRRFAGGFLDTKAQIEFLKGDYESAEKSIQTSEDILKDGEDFSCLADTLWTKIRILMALDYKSEAVKTFIELNELTATHLSEEFVNKYVNEFSNLITTAADSYKLKKEQTLPEAMKSFEQNLILRAFAKEKTVVAASKSLGISHQALSDMVRRKNPELAEILGLNSRASRKKTI
jgi:tetratricopeptide (TPR) repeat protein